MESQEKKVSALSGFIDYIELFVVAICIVIVLFSLAFRTCTVDGSSMNNTLMNGEMLVVSDMMYSPERGDIIVFHHTDGTLSSQSNKPLVKRVIGVGGDTVRINYDTWKVTVIDRHGEARVIDEDYVYLSDAPSAFFGVKEYKVPQGSLFVMGDNRNGSLDSRYSTIGFVDERSVLGKVLVRVTPISKFGIVK